MNKEEMALVEKKFVGIDVRVRVCGVYDPGEGVLAVEVKSPHLRGTTYPGWPLFVASRLCNPVFFSVYMLG